MTTRYQTSSRLTLQRTAFLSNNPVLVSIIGKTPDGREYQCGATLDGETIKTLMSICDNNIPKTVAQLGYSAIAMAIRDPNYKLLPPGTAFWGNISPMFGMN